MTADAIPIAAAGMVTLSGCWVILRYIFLPHIKLTVATTLSEIAGDSIKQVPILVAAVDRLTNALDRESTERHTLAITVATLTTTVATVSRLVEINQARLNALEQRAMNGRSTD